MSIKIITLVVAMLEIATIHAQSQSVSTPFIFEGFWASNVNVSDSTKESTFLSIQKYAQNRYVVVSVSTLYDRYTYIGGGYIRSDGVLIFKTDKGDTWTLSQGYMRGGKDTIGLSTAKMDEVFDTYVRVTEKLKSWPKEWLSP
jgi:hypothetical protein